MSSCTFEVRSAMAMLIERLIHVARNNAVLPYDFLTYPLWGRAPVDTKQLPKPADHRPAGRSCRLPALEKLG